MTVQAGEMFAIIGANGAGKSTLLRTIAGLHSATSGTVLFDGQDVTHLPVHKRVAAGISLVPEGRHVFGSLRVEENLLAGAYTKRPGPWDIAGVYELFPWMKERRRQPAFQLSGGEQQGLAIARALLANPRLLLLDELSLGLSPVALQRIYAVLPELVKSGLGVLLVEQDVRQALRVADRVQCLLEGRQTLEGTPRPLDPGGDRSGLLRLGPRGAGAGIGVTIVNDIIQGILLGGLFALFACGLSLMFGVMDVINLAHGDVAVAGVYLAVVLIPVTHISALWIFVLAVPIFMIGGYLMQRFLFQPSLDHGAITTLLVTFGLSVVLENVLLEVFTANSHSLDVGSLVSNSWHLSSQIFVPYLDLVILGTAIAVLICVEVFLGWTRTGRLVRAIADDREAAQLVGGNYRHLFGIAAALAFGTVALAGLALGVYTSVAPTSGPTYLLYGFEAVVIGGLGSRWGTLLGGFVLGLATTLGSQVDPNFGALLPHLVFLFVLAVRPRGLFPRRALA